jgi:hypothetical protein
MEVSIPQPTTGLMSSSSTQSLMSNRLNVRLIPQGTIYQLRGALVGTHLHVGLILKATTGQVPISYRGTLLRIPLKVSLIPNRQNKPKT